MSAQYTPNLGGSPGTYAARDAVHVAVAPVVAAIALQPGQHVGLDDKGNAVDRTEKIGIVDPFRSKSVEKGESFWLCLYPNTITNLRHAWAHPSFNSPSADLNVDKTMSEQWLREYAFRVKPYDGNEDVAYRNLLDELRENTLFYHGRDLHSRHEVDDEDELVHHASIVLGYPINLNRFSFNCSC